MTTRRERTVCPGCGLELLVRGEPSCVDSYNASRECTALYARVLGAEFADAVLFGQVHQLTVDTYAAQHAGGTHPDKSVVIHLAGLHLMLERGAEPAAVPRIRRRLARAVGRWPHFDAPTERAAVTVLDVARAGSSAAHAEAVRRWAAAVWRTWAPHHAAVAELVAGALSGEPAPARSGAARPQ